MENTTEDNMSVERVGDYLNIYTNGLLRVSLNEQHDEVLVYEDGKEDPAGHFSFEDGSPKRNP